LDRSSTYPKLCGDYLESGALVEIIPDFRRLDGDSYATLQLPGALHVNSAPTYEAAALAGIGLIQAPLLGIGR
jgi:hypothetical protein